METSRFSLHMNVYNPNLFPQLRDLVARRGRLDIDVIQPGKRFEHRERCLYHLNRLAAQLALKRTGENGLPISVELIDRVMLHLPVRESSSEMSSTSLRPLLRALLVPLKTTDLL